MDNSKKTSLLTWVLALALVGLVSFNVGSYFAKPNLEKVKAQAEALGLTFQRDSLSSPDGVVAGDLLFYTKRIVLEVGQATTSFKNTTGRDLVLWQGELRVRASSTLATADFLPDNNIHASGTMRNFLFASSSPGVITTDATTGRAPIDNASTTVLVNGWILSTSTPVSITDRTVGIFSSRYGSSTQPLAIIPDGGEVVLLNQSFCALTSNICVDATSTERGYKVEALLFFHN